MNAPRESPERIRELLALYRRTHYDVVLPDGATATLRVGQLPSNDIAQWVDTSGSAFHLSACNPRSQPLPADENRERMSRLRGVLGHAGARWLEGCGHAPGGTWSEPGLLVAGIPPDRIDRIAREFEQNASVRIAAGEPARLRLHRHDWRDQVAVDVDLEWCGS